MNMLRKKIVHLLEVIGKMDSYEVKANVGRNPLTPEKELRRFGDTKIYWHKQDDDKMNDLHNKELELRVALAENPSTPKDLRIKLAKDGRIKIIEALLRNPSITENEVAEMAQFSNNEIKKAILKYYKPITPNIAEKLFQNAPEILKISAAKETSQLAVLEELEKSELQSVKIALLSNPSISDDMIRRVYESLPAGTFSNKDHVITKNPAAPSDLLDKLSRTSGDNLIVQDIIANPSTECKTLEYLANKRESSTYHEPRYGELVKGKAKKEISIRNHFTIRNKKVYKSGTYRYNSRISISDLKDLAQSSDKDEQIKAAKNPRTPLKTLLELALKSDKLREEVINNPAIPEKLAEELAKIQRTSLLCQNFSISHSEKLLDQPLGYSNNFTEEYDEFANLLAINLLQAAIVLQRIEQFPEIEDILNLSDSDMEVFSQKAKELRRAQILKSAQSIPEISEFFPEEIDLEGLVGEMKVQIPTLSGKVDEILSKVEDATEIRTQIGIDKLQEIIDRIEERLQYIAAKRIENLREICAGLLPNRREEPSIPN